VLNELRHEMALQYLRKERASVNEAAYLPGFSEPAAFSRAFFARLPRIYAISEQLRF
jgi:AraC-like DNA-binding protein